ncbi:MAG: hypothetical protein FJ241_03415 [Nitrospira sp.]|nr:hypothetical protein [Nitrospira sp.]
MEIYKEMQGIDIAYLDNAIKTSIRALKKLENLTISEALKIQVTTAKPDTLHVDYLTEFIYKQFLSDFDQTSIIITEEIGRTPPGILLSNDKIVYFLDPIDRSKNLSSILEESKTKFDPRETRLKEIFEHFKNDNSILTSTLST